jgi:hypothetical protein
MSPNPTVENTVTVKYNPSVWVRCSPKLLWDHGPWCIGSSVEPDSERADELDREHEAAHVDAPADRIQDIPIEGT